MAEIDFSIIVPVYNVAEYLKRCLNSIINQTYKNFELILIDDGSTDQSPAICDEYSINYTNVNVIHKQNAGVAAARTTGVQNAKGNFLLFIDSDDYIEANLLKNLIENQNKNNSEIIIFGYSRVDENGNIQRKEEPKSIWKKNDILNSSDALSFLVWNKMYSKTLFNGIDFASTEKLIFGEDTLLTVQLLAKTEKVSCLEGSYYNWFVRSNSVSQNMSQKTYDQQLYVAEQIPRLLNCTEEPYACLVRKLKAKFYLINPDIVVSYKGFKKNAKEWNRLFPETKSIIGKNYVTKFYKLYIKLICNYFYLFAYFVLKIKLYLKP